MENRQPFQLDYSSKNIPLPSEKEFIKQLITKTDKFIKNLRWRAFYFLNPDLRTSSKNTFGFNTTRSPPFVNELKQFEDELVCLIKSIKFKPNYRPEKFQQQLKKDIEKIKKNKDVLFINADKTSNIYKLKPKEYEELVKINLTKNYHKSNDSIENKCIEGDKIIAEDLDLSDRIDVTAKREAFITLKDHKPNFEKKLPCRLINPCKTEIGKISKQLLEKINEKIRNATNLNQWRRTEDTIEWFKTVENKNQCRAISFDICEFYPSITKELLCKALEYAKRFVYITDKEKNIILHTKSSTTYKDGQAWKKNKADFDVAMGSYDGAETCELVGLFLLEQLKNVDASIGLYRDDGLAICHKNAKQTEEIKKQICHIFKENQLSITIEANLKKVDFLDVTLDLEKETHEPYQKPNNIPKYVHKNSNHPPSVIKQIPIGINKRLSKLSMNEDIYAKHIGQYQEQLEKSGYKEELKYEKEKHRNNKKETRKRKRKITWFNPPYSKNVNTNIGRKTLELIDKCFPKEHKLSKICNKNTIKVSYSCMPNVGQIIAAHNKSTIKKSKNTNNAENDTKTCNCRVKNNCPLDNNCLVKGVVYQATVKPNDEKIKTETYIGVTENTFKTRYTEHTSNFRNEKRKSATTLSEHIWKLKKQNKEFEIKWKIIEKAAPYSPVTKFCNLCTIEKYYIIAKPEEASLNKRSEIAACCRHRHKFLLKNQSNNSTPRQHNVGSIKGAGSTTHCP